MFPDRMEDGQIRGSREAEAANHQSRKRLVSQQPMQAGKAQRRKPERQGIPAGLGDIVLGGGDWVVGLEETVLEIVSGREIEPSMQAVQIDQLLEPIAIAVFMHPLHVPGNVKGLVGQPQGQDRKGSQARTAHVNRSDTVRVMASPRPKITAPVTKEKRRSAIASLQS